MSRFFDPLTYRHPRSIAETQDQRFEWWTSGANVDAEEHELREQFGDAPQHWNTWASVVVSAVAFCGLAALLALMLR